MAELEEQSPSLRFFLRDGLDNASRFYYVTCRRDFQAAFGLALGSPDGAAGKLMPAWVSVARFLAELKTRGSALPSMNPTPVWVWWVAWAELSLGAWGAKGFFYYLKKQYFPKTSMRIDWKHKRFTLFYTTVALGVA